jgi:cobalt-zinc-cadmium efflux system protein
MAIALRPPCDLCGAGDIWPMSHSHDHGDHDHRHDAGHAPGQVHAPASFGRAFIIGIGLNIGFVVAEAAAGWIGNSVALLADAGHNLSDVLGLAVAWAATVLAGRLPSARFTYGLRGSSILAALFNAVLLLLAVGAIGWEAVMRLAHPQASASLTVIVVAAIGILVNGATALLFASGRKGDLNVRGAFLHMVADAAVSAAVVVAGLLMLATGWLWLDPLASLLVCVVIVWSTWSLLRDSVAMSLAAVPASVDPAEVRGYLAGLQGVEGLHDLHIWPMSTTEIALTAHLKMSGGHPGDGFLRHTSHELEHRFGIAHPTLQIEVDPLSQCELAPDEVV